MSTAFLVPRTPFLVLYVADSPIIICLGRVKSEGEVIKLIIFLLYARFTDTNRNLLETLDPRKDHPSFPFLPSALHILTYICFDDELETVSRLSSEWRQFAGARELSKICAD